MIPIQTKGESRQLFEWVKASVTPDEYDTYTTMIEQRGDGKVSQKPVFSRWNGQWLTEEGWTVVEWLKPIQSSLKEETDLHQQVIDHIRNYKLFAWDEALTDNEMSLLEDMFMSFNPLCPPGSIGFEEQKRHIESQSSLTPKSISDSWISDEDKYQFIKNLIKEYNTGLQNIENDYTILWHERQMVIEIYNKYFSPPPNEISASLKPNKLLDSEIQKMAEEYADKHGFRVPYDGSNKFYNDDDVKWSKEGFIAGCKAILER